MSSPNLRDCCQTAELDGEKPEEHFPRCDARREDPGQDALFDITPQPQKGGPLL